MGHRSKFYNFTISKLHSVPYSFTVGSVISTETAHCKSRSTTGVNSGTLTVKHISLPFISVQQMLPERNDTVVYVHTKKEKNRLHGNFRCKDKHFQLVEQFLFTSNIKQLSACFSLKKQIQILFKHRNCCWCMN